MKFPNQVNGNPLLCECKYCYRSNVNLTCGLYNLSPADVTVFRRLIFGALFM